MSSTVVLATSALSAALYLVAIAMFAVLHRRVPEANWVSDAVSNYAVGPSASFFRRYSHVSTTAAALLAIQFVLWRSPAIPRVAVICMVLTPFLRIGVTLVPTDGPGAAPSARGRLHLVLAIASFAASYTAISNASPTLAAAASPWLAAILSGIYGVATLALIGVVVGLLPFFKRLFGLFERAFLLSTMLWFLAANIVFLLATGSP